MKNEFVTYEQALALKELGFLPEHSFGYYYNCKLIINPDTLWILILLYTNKHLDGLEKNIIYVVKFIL
jgi:hypothetical protein